MQQGSNGCVDVCVGHVLVYVDDIMALAKDDVRNSFLIAGNKNGNAVMLKRLTKTTGCVSVGSN